ncbi:hypothetical protein [Methylobacterium sp. J-090]|uniref:hypothetical protein n=1 Tax=Methylobacterium sp. J-090 TaxID=2836666 RepID=UPI001FB9AB18|nr:hypothetical protein [Methylobacterium sp. J-090]MCJ2079866.1 hypothetical protein [Methylobacterium sp. J-090]
MLPNFTVHAIKGSEKKKIPCVTAIDAVSKRLMLIRQGWGVSMSNHLGMPISEARVDAQAKDEAAQNS